MFCLLAAGVALACVLGMAQLATWWTGIIFPGTQFFYTSHSTTARIFRLTVDNSNHVVRVRIAPDYIQALFPGDHWNGYGTIVLTAYLPNMVPEQIYDAAKNDHDRQLLEQLRISLSQSNGGPGDPTGKIGYVTNAIKYAEKHEIFLRKNPYNAYNAYIFSDHMPQTFADRQNTWTDYVPKKDKSYYIDCSGMPVSESQCDILFVYAGIIAVDVGTTSKNIPKAELIIKKVSTFLGRATNTYNSNIFDKGIK